MVKTVPAGIKLSFGWSVRSVVFSKLITLLLGLGSLLKVCMKPPKVVPLYVIAKCWLAGADEELETGGKPINWNETPVEETCKSSVIVIVAARLRMLSVLLLKKM